MTLNINPLSVLIWLLYYYIETHLFENVHYQKVQECSFNVHSGTLHSNVVHAGIIKNSI